MVSIACSMGLKYAKLVLSIPVLILLIVSRWPWHISLGVLRITSMRVCVGLHHSSLLAVSCNHAPVISRSGRY